MGAVKGERLKPVYICQLPQAQQDEVRKMLESIHLYDCNGQASDFEKFHGISLEKAIQDGMDSKIVDLDYLMVAYVQRYADENEDKRYRFADTAIIAGLLNEVIGRIVYPIIEEETKGSLNGDWER